MSRFCTLFSGSSGNCTFISDGKTNLLVDAGVSASRICSSLSQIGCAPSDLHGILVTHEHHDHIAGIGAMSRNFSIPVYANAGTMEKTIGTSGWIYEDNIHIFKTGENFAIGDIEVYPFPISHDTVEPVGYTFCFNGKYYSVATDIGYVTDDVLRYLCKSEAVLLESNHDVQMVNDGPYPYYLKKRILGQQGHLSNENASLLAAQLVKWGTEQIIFGHLSEKNNTPQKAYDTAKECFERSGIKTSEDVILQIAPADGICEFSM